MQLGKIHILVFIMFSITVVNVFAQNNWATLYKEAQHAYNADDVESSLHKGKECLTSYLQESGEMNGNYRSILRLLVTSSYSLGMVEEGIGYAKKEIEILEAMEAPKDLTYASAYYNLGSLFQLNNQYPEAQKQLSETLNIYKQYYSETDDQYIECNWKLASVLYSQENIIEAKDLFEKSFSDYGERDEVTMDYVQSAYDYGSLLVEQGENDKGISYLSTVKDIYEASELGNTESYAGLLTTMANAYQQVNRVRAEEYYAIANGIYEEFNNQEAIQEILNNRAVNLQVMGQTGQAEALLASAASGSSDITALINKAAISQQNGDYEGAEEIYRQAMVSLDDKKSILYAQIVENLAILLSITDRSSEALSLINNAIEIITVKYGNEHSKYAAVVQKKASILSKLKQFDEAESLFITAIKILSPSETERKELTRSLNALAVMYKEEGNYNNADSVFEQALTTAESSVGTSHPYYSLVMNNLAALKEIKGDHLGAKSLIVKSIEISRKTSKIQEESFINQLGNLATIHMELGEYSEAENVLKEVKGIVETHYGSKSEQYANNLLSQGRLEQIRGRYTSAEPLFLNSTEIIKNKYGVSHPKYAHALHMTALLYQILGNLSEAEPLFLQCRDIYLNSLGKTHPDYITTIENLSSLYQIKGENDKALPLLEEALAMDIKVYGEEHPNYAVTLHNLASLYQRKGELSKAEPLFLKALDIDANTLGKNHRTYANTLYNLATLYQDLSKFDQAEVAFNEAVRIRENVLGKEHPDYAYSLYGLAALYHGTNQLEKANSYYNQTINLYLRQIDEYFPSMSEKEKSAFYSKIKPVFDAFFDFCIDYISEGSNNYQNVLADMYNLQLSTKALLLNATNKVRDRILNSNDQNLINKYKEWIAMKERMVKYLKFSKEELAAENINIDQIKQEANGLEKELSSMSSEFAQEYDMGLIDWKKIQTKLEAKDASAEIIRITKKFDTDSVVYAVLIVKKTSELPELVVLPNGNALESRLFNYYRNAIKFSIGDEISYQNYWKAITDKLDGVNRLYLSADGIYNKLNVNTLWDAAEKVNVINELELRLVSNSRELVENTNVESNTSNVAQVFGFPDFNLGFSSQVSSGTDGVRASSYGFQQGITPLLGTEIEVNSIKTILDDKEWKNTINTGREATEERIKDIESPKLLHIASHGFFMNDISFDDRDHSFEKGYNNLSSNPLLRSGVLLTGSAKTIFGSERQDGEDGVLTAYEAMNLHLDDTDLVVLSACETGLGQVRNGEGVYGLQRAFIVAGANSVIMSLWKVNDITTQELMVSFYQNWLGGMDKYEAFKKAQLTLKEKYDDPYHWGAFVLLGK